MSEHRERQPALEQLVDLRCQLRADAGRPEHELRRRDRPIGLELGAEVRPRRQLAHWLGRVSAAGEPTPGRHAVAALRLVGLVLILLGLAIGWAAAAAVFRYDGSRPVNVVRVLAVFVAPQVVLMLLWLILALPLGIARYVPGFGTLQDVLGWFSPGRLQPLVARVLPQALRQSLQQALGEGRGHQKLYGRVQKWAVMLWSQGFAVAFNVGALLGCLSLIAFKDTWFAWSTTLQIEPERLHAWTSTLAAPWAWWRPEAVPPLALIEATRYFQIDQGPAAGIDPAELGAWWRFLVMAMVVYGLLPRVVALAVARWRFAVAVHLGILHTPDVGRLLARLTQHLVETRAEQPEAAPPAPGGAGPTPVAGSFTPGATVNWAGVDLDDAEAALVAAGGSVAASIAAPVLHAGGALDRDGPVIDQIAGSKTEQPVAVLVKAWEPPMLDFVDFVVALRQAIGDGRQITVLPVGLERAAGRAPAPLELAAWRDTLQRVGDPWLSVWAPVGEEGP